MFALDVDNEISMVGGSLASWFQREPSDLVGEKIYNLLVDEDIPRLRSALTTVRKGSGVRKQSFTCELDTDGDNPTVEMELSLVVDQSQEEEILGSVIPKSGYQIGEDEEDRLECFEHFFEPMDKAVAEFEIVDGEPIVRAVNTAFEKTFGYHEGYITGKSLNDYTVPDSHTSEATAIDAEISSQNIVKGEYTRKTASGAADFYCRFFPIGTDSEEQHGLATYTDITEDHQRRQYLQVLNRVLRHNLRNDLTVILGMADEIAAQGEPAEVRQAASRISDRAEKLVGVSTKAQIAQDVLKQSEVDTVTDVGQAANDVVSEAEEKWPDATIESDIETPLPVATGLEIRVALDNLLDNAITHNTGNPVVNIDVYKHTPIHLTTRSYGQEAVITIKDNGPGIPENERAVVFDEEEINKLNHGSGFGLWVVRWITESAGGCVNHERTNGTTEIQLRLPIIAGT